MLSGLYLHKKIYPDKIFDRFIRIIIFLYIIFYPDNNFIFSYENFYPDNIFICTSYPTMLLYKHFKLILFIRIHIHIKMLSG